MLNKESLEVLNLREGCMRHTSMVHNGGWYNSQGVKIGWGDLNSDDFKRIQGKLNQDEMFVVLGERDSFWNFVTNVGMIGSMSAVKPEEQCPGVKYLASKARFIITNDTVYCADASEQSVEWQSSKYNMACKSLDRKDVADLLAKGK